MSYASSTTFPLALTNSMINVGELTATGNSINMEFEEEPRKQNQNNEIVLEIMQVPERTAAVGTPSNEQNRVENSRGDDVRGINVDLNMNSIFNSGNVTNNGNEHLGNGNEHLGNENEHLGNENEHLGNENIELNPELKAFDAALKGLNDEASYAAATKMLLNYDKTKYMAIPIEDQRPRSARISNPISIVGYNYIDAKYNYVDGKYNYVDSKCNFVDAKYNCVDSKCNYPDVKYSFVDANTNSINRICASKLVAAQNQQQQSQQTSAIMDPLNMIVLKCDEVLPETSSSSSSEESSSNPFQPSGSYNCTVCPRKFFTKEYLHCHMIKCHNLRIVSNPGNYLGYVSQVEGKKLVSFQKVQDPAPTLTMPNRKYKCQICPKSYSYSRNLEKHEKSAHSSYSNTSCRQQPPVPSGNPGVNCIRIVSYQCRICKQQFLDEGALNLHLRLHASTCQVCYKVFGTKRGLKLHSAIHFGNQDKQFGCKVCEKRYSHARSLKHHMKSHGVGGLTMEAEPQVQPENDVGNDFSMPFTPETNDDMEFVSYTFGAVEETL